MAQNSSLNSLRPPCLCRVHYRSQGQADEKHKAEGERTRPALCTRRGTGSSCQPRNPGTLYLICWLKSFMSPRIYVYRSIFIFLSLSLLCLGMGRMLRETRMPSTLFSGHFGWTDWTVSSHPPLGSVQECVAIPRFLCSSDLAFSSLRHLCDCFEIQSCYVAYISLKLVY